ncbi:TIGR00725 family protein [Halapricum salinum]|uniref:TIGR00725 family protein n=1 Tax=Halapricum salinum TaxID=1457250 RepID=A0A4D6H9P3_9EURY|nr:TIGR00725 family protein [Halapricum salinum]QCC50683.1 TIGR00725 family protein [Halapricum salinum]
MRVSVIGSSSVTNEHYATAREVGRLLGERGHEIVCGGRTGVMEAVCRGGQETGAHTIGILPGEHRSQANEYVETAIATGLGNARNALVALNGDAAIAVDGSTGTLSEIALSLDRGIPVAGLDSYEIEGVESVATPQEAVDYVESARD